MLRKRGEEERPSRNSKLQAVFSKLSGVLPKPPHELGGSPKTMSSEIIESVLVDTPVPAPSSEYRFLPLSFFLRGVGVKCRFFNWENGVCLIEARFS